MRSWRRAQQREVGKRASGRTTSWTTRLGALGLAASSLLGLGLASSAPASAASATFVNTAFSPAGGGWEVTASGAVDPFGGASSFGSLTVPINAPIVAMTATSDGGGYWLVSQDGGIFSFGDARFMGSTGAMHLNQRIVGMAATPDGGGYWLVASDGGIFSFGDARYFGSTGAMHLNQPIVGMASTSDGGGYWLVAKDGGIFSFGDAHFMGSLGSSPTPDGIIGIVRTAAGYNLIGAGGAYYSFVPADATSTTPTPTASQPAVSTATGTSTSAPSTPVSPVVPAADAISTTPTPTASQPAVSTATGTSTSAPSTPVSPVVPAPVTSTPTAQSMSFGVFSQQLDTSAVSVKVASQSQSFVQDFVSDYQNNYGAVGVNEMPIWTVPANQPLVTVKTTAGCNSFQAGTGAQLPIPPAATTLGYSDSPLIIDQPSTHTDWELWQVEKNSDGTWSACWGGKLNTVTSDGVFPVPYGLSGSGISYLATTITNADVASGAIDHALAVDLPACNAPAVAPANRTDCGSDAGQPSEGQWYRLPATLAMPSGLTPFGQMVFYALQNYGMVVTDRAGAVMVQAENADDWSAEGNSGPSPMTTSWAGQPEYSVLNGIPWGSLEVVNS
jgi:hypothetical protein